MSIAVRKRSFTEAEAAAEANLLAGKMGTAVQAGGRQSYPDKKVMT